MDFMCLPLAAQGDTIGVLSVGTSRAEGFADDERQTIQAVTEQLSLALANLRLQETLRMQSLRDQLTGLFNRRYLDEALTREIARARRHGQPLTVAMLDIDHFKRFNDTFGHQGGDALLAAFGELLGGHARTEDIACRYGGEEFALVLPGANLATAAERVDELRKKVKEMHVHLNGQPLGPVTVSAGVAVFPLHGRSGAAVMKMADNALYQAKEAGRDRVVTAPGQAEQLDSSSVQVA